MRQRSKEDRDAVKARLIEAVRKDPDLERRVLAARFGVNVGTVVDALKAAGVYESRAQGKGRKEKRA